MTTDRNPADFLPLSPPMFHVLLSLAQGERHGYLIMKEVEERTGGAVRLSTGTLYGIIKRLLDSEMVEEVAAADPRRRAYKLTAFGQVVARAEAERLESLVEAARFSQLLARKAEQ
jgi:DNA-binding PadR family transcriptional regulator